MVNEKKVLLIDCRDSFTYNLVQLFEEAGSTVDVAAYDAFTPDSCAGYGQIVFSPGPGLPAEYPKLRETLELFSKNRKFLGVCLGHQAIAEYFGGKLAQLAQPLHGIESEVEASDDDLFENCSRFSAGRYHSWHVSELGKVLVSTAKSDDGIIMAFRHSVLNIRGVQFHPESVITRQGGEIIRNWLKIENF
jgi:anthranilate synthase component 2